MGSAGTGSHNASAGIEMPMFRLGQALSLTHASRFGIFVVASACPSQPHWVDRALPAAKLLLVGCGGNPDVLPLGWGGIPQPGEECDEGPTGSVDCSSSCTLRTVE